MRSGMPTPSLSTSIVRGGGGDEGGVSLVSVLLAREGGVGYVDTLHALWMSPESAGLGGIGGARARVSVPIVVVVVVVFVIAVVCVGVGSGIGSGGGGRGVVVVIPWVIASCRFLARNSSMVSSIAAQASVLISIFASMCLRD